MSLETLVRKTKGIGRKLGKHKALVLKTGGCVFAGTGYLAYLGRSSSLIGNLSSVLSQFTLPELAYTITAGATSYMIGDRLDKKTRTKPTGIKAKIGAAVGMLGATAGFYLKQQVDGLETGSRFVGERADSWGLLSPLQSLAFACAKLPSAPYIHTIAAAGLAYIAADWYFGRKR